MDRVLVWPRRRQRKRSALGPPDWRRRSGKADRYQRGRGRFCLVARFKTDRARRPRPRSARAGEKREGEKEGPAAGDQSPFLQEGRRRLSDRTLFAPAIA